MDCHCPCHSYNIYKRNNIFFFCRNDFLARLGLPQRRGKIHFHQSVLIALSAVMLYTVFSPWICPLDADHQTARHVKATVTHISLEQKLTFLLHRIDQGTAPHVGTSFPIKNHRVQGIIICFFSLSLLDRKKWSAIFRWLVTRWGIFPTCVVTV